MQPLEDGTDVNACVRSPDGSLVATADDLGMVRLFNFPCPVADADSVRAFGHAAQVTNLVWSSSSNHLLTTGGEDLALFMWSYTHN